MLQPLFAFQETKRRRRRPPLPEAPRSRFVSQLTATTLLEFVSLCYTYLLIGSSNPKRSLAIPTKRATCYGMCGAIARDVRSAQCLWGWLALPLDPGEREGERERCGVRERDGVREEKVSSHVFHNTPHCWISCH